MLAFICSYHYIFTIENTIKWHRNPQFTLFIKRGEQKNINEWKAQNTDAQNTC